MLVLLLKMWDFKIKLFTKVWCTISIFATLLDNNTKAKSYQSFFMKSEAEI